MIEPIYETSEREIFVKFDIFYFLFIFLIICVS